MTVQNAGNQNIFTNESSSGKNWQMIDGKCVQIMTDEQGEYFIKGGTEKVYLSEYYYQKSEKAKKDKIQKDITNFFTKQENDFAEWRDDYASKIIKWQKKIEENRCIYKASILSVQEKDSELNPLYRKYNTCDISKFSDGKDKKLGYKLLSERKSAKHSGNVAFGQISVEQMIIDGYRKLMNHSEFCRNTVAKIAQGCIPD